MRIKNLMRTGIINLIFQILFLLAFYLWGSDALINLTGIAKIIFNILIVFIPCLVWATFFYLQDRIEPEPTHYVIVAFIIGMAIASLFQIPIEKYVFQINLWLLTDQLSLLLGSFLILGICISFLFYISLRYGFYISKEFDEPVDGMVYGAFIGCGFAAVKSLNYLSNYDNLTFFATAYITSTNILVFASIASLIGLFIGKAKFTKNKRTLNLIFGLLSGTIMIGIFYVFSNLFYLQGEKSGFLYTFIVTMLLSIIMLVMVFFEMRKLTRKDMHEEVKIDAGINLPVLIIFLIFFIPGVVSYNYYIKDNNFFDQKTGLEFSYSKKLLSSSVPIKTGLFDQILFKKENSSSIGSLKSQYAIVLKTIPFDVDKYNIEDYIPVTDMPYPVNREFFDLNGMKTVRLRYCSISQNENHAWYPDLMLNVYTLVPYKNQTLIFSFSSTAGNFETDFILYEILLNSLKFSK